MKEYSYEDSGKYIHCCWVCTKKDYIKWKNNELCILFSAYGFEEEYESSLKNTFYTKSEAFEILKHHELVVNNKVNLKSVEDIFEVPEVFISFNDYMDMFKHLPWFEDEYIINNEKLIAFGYFTVD